MTPMKNPSAALLGDARLYVRARARLKQIEAHLDQSRDRLLKRIPAGQSAGGLGHLVARLLSGNEKLLRKLGHWPAVTRETIDQEKLKALLKLMPVVGKAGAVTAHELHYLKVLG